MELYIIIIFIIGYVLIALEHPIKINKTATALVTGVLCWTLFALAFQNATFSGSEHYSSFIGEVSDLNLSVTEIYHRYIKAELSHHLSEISSILFFLMGAMTIVELIDARPGIPVHHRQD